MDEFSQNGPALPVNPEMNSRRLSCSDTYSLCTNNPQPPSIVSPKNEPIIRKQNPNASPADTQTGDPIPPPICAGGGGAVAWRGTARTWWASSEGTTSAWSGGEWAAISARIASRCSSLAGAIVSSAGGAAIRTLSSAGAGLGWCRKQSSLLQDSRFLTGETERKIISPRDAQCKAVGLILEPWIYQRRVLVFFF